MIRRTLLAAFAALCFAAPAFAQQQPPKQQEKRTAREIAMDKLKRLGEQAKLDSLRASGDTAALNAILRQRDSAQAVPTVPEAAQQTGQKATPQLARDSLMRELARLPGYTATEYKGISAVFNADTGTLRLKADSTDKAIVVRDGQTMTADSLLTFNQNTAIVCAYGKPVLSGEGADAPVQSELVCYNTNKKEGVAINATTTVNEGAAWKVRANELYTRGTDVYGHTGIFTDCNLEVPHYHFSAGQIKVVSNDVMVARDVTLNFGDVPVLWLPFMVQSMKQGRRSGVLMPDFEINAIVRNSSRYNRKIDNVGFYWAMNDYMGGSLALGWEANNYTSLQASYDFNFLQHFLRGAATVNNYWNNTETGGRNFTIRANSSWEPNERTNVQADVSYASSTAFVSRFSYDPRELNRRITSNGGFSRRFDWGSLSLSASRSQQLSDNMVDLTLPTGSLDFTSVTLFPGEGSWYNNGSWNGGVQFNRTSRRFGDISSNPGARDNDGSNFTGRSSFQLGKISWSQNFSRVNTTKLEREAFDTVAALPREVDDAMEWGTTLNYQQRLIGTSTFTPSLAVRGNMVRSPRTNGEMVSGPARLDAGAQLKFDLFGFWPGIGSMERIRHHLSPSVSYTYSPAPKSTPRLDSIFGLSNTRESNALSFGLTQTIEGKYREDESADSTAAEEDDSASADPTRPRRIKQGRKLSILSLSTNVVTYDFAERKRGGYGFTTTTLSNTINSDLLRGLQVSVTHDLFRTDPLGVGSAPGTRPNREFAPHLSNLSTNFSLNANSWIFRMLGFGGKEDAPPATGSTESPAPQPADAGTGSAGEGGGLGLIGNRPPPSSTAERSPVGSWNANFAYSLDRPRRTENNPGQNLGNSRVGATVMFQPTEKWSVTWETGYSFTYKEFSDHYLTLTRALHDWDANFSFVKAPNGNFSFRFNVALRANNDLKFDYHQRESRRGLTTAR